MLPEDNRIPVPQSLVQKAQEAEDDPGVLERMIERIGLIRVLCLISTVCEDKADHLRTNWQDKRGAAHWDRWAKLIDGAASKVNK